MHFFGLWDFESETTFGDPVLWAALPAELSEEQAKPAPIPLRTKVRREARTKGM